jgi:hypothetical protein
VTVGAYTVPLQIFALANISAPSLEALPCDGLMGEYLSYLFLTN